MGRGAITRGWVGAIAIVMAGCPSDPSPVEAGTSSASGSGGGTLSGGDATTSSDAMSSSAAVDADTTAAAGASSGTAGCVPRPYYPDGDGDGWGDPARSVDACVGEQPEGWIDVGDDCDDDEPLRNPGHQELCGDALDNDCDDKQDEWSVDNAACNGCVMAFAGSAHYVCTAAAPDTAWVDQAARCEDFGAEVASVHGGEENDAIAGLLDGSDHDRAYLGFVLPRRRDMWSWADGSATDFEGWAPGQPEAGQPEERCAVIATDGAWTPAVCDGATVTAVVCRDPTP